MFSRSRSRGLRTGALAGGLLLAASMLLGATGANALTPNPSGGAAALDCTNALDIGYTIQDGSQIKGQGSWTKCDGNINRVVVDIYQSSGTTGGIFFPIATHDNNPANFGSWWDNISAGCASGTHTYYTTVRSWDTSGNLTGSKTSNSITVTC